LKNSFFDNLLSGRFEKVQDGLFQQPVRWNTALLLASALLIAGCATSPRARHYLIPPVPTGNDAAPFPADKVIGLGPVTLPEYLSRPQMAIRTGPGGVEYRDVHRWAEPLADNVPRVLKEDLSARLQTDRIVDYPWPRATSVNIQAKVEISRFDADGAGNVTLEGRWSLHLSQGAVLIAGQRFSITAPAAVADPAAIALAHGEALAQLARELAGALERFPPTE
jgi:hypothetical protein